jgi:hypothetical protein
MVDLYSAAARSFQEDLDRIEKDGRRDSPDWHLAKGLLQLTQGLQQAREEEEDLRAARWVKGSFGPRARTSIVLYGCRWQGVPTVADHPPGGRVVSRHH